MRKSFGDMVRSLGLMAVIVGVLLFIGARYLIAPGSADRMPAVDYTSVVQGFREVGGVPAVGPHGLPAGWRANAARLLQPTPGTEQMHVGWALPGSRYAGLDEATGNVDSVLSSVLGTRGQAVQGTTTIGGADWQTRTSSRGEEAFTRQAGRLLVIVTGNATDAQLRALAASLH